MGDRTAERRAVAAFWLSLTFIGFRLPVVEGRARAQEPADVTIAQGIFTREQAKRGDLAYQKACAACHLTDLAGQQTAPALAGDTFLLNVEGQTLADLFERIQTTMPQDAVGSLSPQTYADIVAFILQANRFRAGDRELGTEVEPLRKVIITRAATK